MKRLILVLVLVLTGCIAVDSGEYEISNVTYTYSGADASQIVAVDFDVYPPLSQVAINLGNGYSPCEMFAGYTHAHCHVNVPMSAAKELRIK